MSPLERAIFQYTYLYQHALSLKDGAIFINYDKMLLNPDKYFKQVSNFLNLHYGPKTDKILADFKEPSKDRTMILEDVSQIILDEMYSVYQKCVERCIAV